jgi:trigger factor
MPEAEQALKREAVIAAVVAAEQLRPSDDDVLIALQPLAEREGVEPAELLADLQKSGRIDEVREDLAARQAVDLIADAAKPIPREQAAAREALWTPEKAEGASGGAGGRLWTPGS